METIINSARCNRTRLWKWGCNVTILALVILMGDRLVGAADSSPGMPTSKPGQSNNKILKQWVQELSDDDSTVREKACVKLMGMDRNDLKLLSEMLKTMPLDAQQRAMIPGIVKQVYMATEPYERLAQGFLGLRFDLDQQMFDPMQVGVEVRHRLPGFCAFRFLEDGDVILRMAPSAVENIVQGTGGASVKERTHPALVDVHGVEEFQSIVKSCAPNQALQMEILRRGRVLLLAVPLDSRPVLPANEGLSIDNFETEREQAAEDYYLHTFAPVIDHEPTSGKTSEERAAGR